MEHMAYTNDTKPPTTITYLLKEDGFYLLQENGDKIVLSYSGAYTKDNKPSSAYTNDTKPV